MKEPSPDGPYIDRLRSWASSKVHGGNRSAARRPGPLSDPSLLPISSGPTRSTTHSASQASATHATLSLASTHGGSAGAGIPLPDAHNVQYSGNHETSQNAGSHIYPQASPQSSSSAQASRTGPKLKSDGPSESNEKIQADQEGQKADKPSIVKRFFATSRKILLHSWLNVLLIFVPVGIAVEFVPNISPTVVFTMNAIAIIPLAGLLSHATETVAHRMGDAIGALLNITFGNAVELIIFIALVKNEIAIVQASLLGSILANLLLILGMCFLLGGLRFREQIYNSTVTQMSACLLSLSVISLVLPTAFHASFSDTTLADEKSLIISRGTSIILLLVYLIYLVFQLKSHAYMYESTPQEVIDAEATPGPAVAWFDSSSSDDSSSSSSDSDSSGRSRETMTKRVKRMVRHPRRRKSSMASMDTMDTSNTLRTRPPQTSPTAEVSPSTEDGPSVELGQRASPLFTTRTNSFEDVDTSTDDDRRRRRKSKYKRSYRRYKKQLKKLHSHSQGASSPTRETITEVPETGDKNMSGPGEPRRVDFAVNAGQSSVVRQSGEGLTSKRPFDALLALKPVAKNLTPTVFAQPPNTTTLPAIPGGPVPRVRYGIRRTNSLPGRLNEHQIRAPGAMLPSQLSAQAIAQATGTQKPDELFEDDLSRVSAVLLLLVSTGLVAVCAEFMVDSINGLVETSNVSELFIGLIVLPIVGNAAEHVTAITVAMKNKMDLAIGVAVGSSIQIALFMTPLVVIIGWCMEREMTLYFTLFETVCLFVSAFIANFLVLDGRSNYLEGALLCATYVIIGLVSFFYPN